MKNETSNGIVEIPVEHLGSNLEALRFCADYARKRVSEAIRNRDQDHVHEFEEALFKAIQKKVKAEQAHDLIFGRHNRPR